MAKFKLEHNEWYTLQDIVRHRLFPWCGNSFWSHRKLLLLDKKNNNILSPTIIGKGRATKYHFKGKNIIRFISLVESGKVTLK